MRRPTWTLVMLVVTVHIGGVHPERRIEAQAATTRAVANIPFGEARAVLESLRPDLLPEELRAKTTGQLESSWPEWVARRDAEIRARVDRGDEDSVINLLLSGVTFTTQPRVTERDVLRVGRTAELMEGPVVQGRLSDMVAGISAPGTNERLQFARRLVEARGIRPETEAGRQQVRQYLIERLRRVLAESDVYSGAKSSPSLAGDRLPAAVEELTFFRSRGLSSDTSIFPGFAVERALEAINSHRLLDASGIRRVAVIGPGLDFTDKRDGYDFYPQQTIQPFAAIDSLIRLGLASRERLQLTTFDLSPRINQHIEAAVRRAHASSPYVLNLTRAGDAPWRPDLVAYWERFGDQIGEPAAAVPPPASAGGVRLRAVRVRPSIVASIVPRDVNIVLQRPRPTGPGDRFDVVIATNILVYYDLFEQCLALINVAQMLRPGGFFLANSDVPLLPPLPFSRVGYTELAYTDAPNSTDRLVWYQRQ
jgi:hypothetical protein